MGRLTTLILAGVLLGSCSEKPIIEEKKDLTGDGRPDTMVYIDRGPVLRSGRYLIIDNPGGPDIRAEEREIYDGCGSRIEGRPTYFQADNGDIYFWDGTKYVLSPPREK